MHLFKKGDKSNGKIKSSREDLADSEDAELRNRSANGSNRLGSYEQTEPGLGVTPNGPNRTSMVAMREGGTILTVRVSCRMHNFLFLYSSVYVMGCIGSVLFSFFTFLACSERPNPAVSH